MLMSLESHLSEKLEITKNEASHLVNIINDYMGIMKDHYIESTVHITQPEGANETTTQDVLAKLVEFITS